MATIKFKCECGKELSAPVETIGKASKCSCGREVVVPGPPAPKNEYEMPGAVTFFSFLRIAAWVFCAIMILSSWSAVSQARASNNPTDVAAAIYTLVCGYVVAKLVDGTSRAILARADRL